MDKIQSLVVPDLCTGERAIDIAARYDINRRTVYKIKRLYETTGGFSKHNRGGRPRSSLTESNLARIKEATTKSPTKSISRLSNKLSIPRTSVSRGIKELGGKSLTIISQPMLTVAEKEHQLERAKALLNKLKKGKEGTIIFCDEKQFTVNKFNNHRNSRFLDFRDTPEHIRYCPKIITPSL